MDGRQVPCQQVDPEVLRLVALASRQLAGRYGFSRDEEDDLGQELVLDYLRRLKGFDSTRCSPRTFAGLVTKHRTASLIEHQTAQCRDARLSVSLEAVSRPARPRRNRNEESVARRIDVARVIRSLPADLARVCVLLSSDFRVAEIGTVLGVSRATLYRRLQVIREAFERAGFRSLR